MPLINGMKMACEPCIRGHRSTKCTHANERLMVPVRKPGRPLSSCPHPHHQQCGCGSVTAAIPRKQACHCGTSTPPMSSGQVTPQDSQSNTDTPSLSRLAFKIQKTISRPQSSRKQSFDPVNFDRMNVNSINIIPFEQRPQGVSFPYAKGYALPGGPQPYGYDPQYANLQTQFSHLPTEATPHTFQGVPEVAKGFNRESTFEHAAESPLATPTEPISNGSNGTKTVGSCCDSPAPISGTNLDINNVANEGSCCAPKLPSHRHSTSSASSISEPPDFKGGSCCSKPAPMMKQESTSADEIPIMIPEMLPPNGMAFNFSLHPQYLHQNTVFTYPATYGSFQNPLQPSAWRQSIRTNSYTHHQKEAPLQLGSLPLDSHFVSESLDTLHTCHCGDSCQCIGCAAHPYNDATQDYVRSAWSMNMEQDTGNVNAKGQSNGNGHITPSSDETTALASSTTPSSTTSGNVEEQNFSAADFFFVNYPFSSEEGCGGDTESCPCGDDCQCFGCAIHQNPGITCEGQKDDRLCGDDCECIGCEIHNGSMKG